MINLIFPLTLVDILYVYTVGVINILGYSISPFWKTTLIIVDALLLLLVLFYILLTKYKNIPASSNELLKQIPIDLTEINPQFFDEIINKLNRKYKCYECKIYKPERTHHCSTCRQCYLKMDHHCVFLNCCIHFHNFKFFLIGLFFGLLYNLYNIMHIIILHNYNAYNTVAVVLCTINFILCTVLFSVNIMQALRNETTIERMTIDQVLRDDFSHIDNFQIGIIRQLNHHITDRATLNPYNINMKYNIQSVLGKSLKELFSFEIVGNGLEFEKNNKIF